MATNKRSYKRRNYFIKKSFQTHFILVFILLVTLGVFLSTGFVLLDFRGKQTTVFADTGLSVTDTVSFSIPAIVYANLITIVTISLLMIVVTLLVSHKIAGPLYRLETDIAKIATGNLTHRITLRKGDQFRELSMDINRMTENLNDKITGIQIELQTIVNASVEENLSGEFLEELHGLQKKLNDHFTVKISDQ